MSDTDTDADVLLELAHAVQYRRGELMVVEGGDGQLCEMVALSLRLRARPDVMLRALVERWNRFQIVRELY